MTYKVISIGNIEIIWYHGVFFLYVSIWFGQKNKWISCVLLVVVIVPTTTKAGMMNINLQQACEAVRKGMSSRRAAEEFAIPWLTLHDHTSGRIVFGAKSGPKSFYLTANEEDELVQFLSGMAKVGYSRTVKQVIEIVQAAIDHEGLNVSVSPSWWKSFRSQHKDICLPNPETLTHSRLHGASEEMIEHYFDLLEKTLAYRIWNLWPTMPDFKFRWVWVPIEPKASKSCD